MECFSNSAFSQSTEHHRHGSHPSDGEPTAIQAGLCLLGQCGSMITAEPGSNVCLATVLTDLPLAIDQPRNLGVDGSLRPLVCHVGGRCGEFA